MNEENYRFQYEQWHEDTPESKKLDIRLSSEFISLHGLWPEKKDDTIFDVGCGMGRFLLAYRENGYKNISGVDIDSYQIAVAKKEKLEVKKMEAIKFFKKNKKKFDLITMIDCLEHIDKDKQIKLLRNINKSLSEDGKLVIRVPNALSPSFGYMRYIDFTHKNSYTKESLNYILKNSDFSKIIFRPAWQETKEIVSLKKSHAKLLNVEFGITAPILSSNIVAVAFKSEAECEKYEQQAPIININYDR